MENRNSPVSLRLAPRRFVLGVIALATTAATATEYEVGDGKPYTAIGSVPWESLQAGDTVSIFWREMPYREKWVIGRAGTATAPITVRGIPGPAGVLPVIDGNNAITRTELDYWNEKRSVIKVGGSSTPPNTLPEYIVIENLDLRGARPPNTFTDDAGGGRPTRPTPRRSTSNAAPTSSSVAVCFRGAATACSSPQTTPRQPRTCSSKATTFTATAT